MTPVDIRDLALRLTRRPSVTNTPGEASYGAFLEDELRRLAPATEAPSYRVWREPTLPGDPFPGRDIVFALARGGSASRDTILLTGHYDTVPLTPYGPALEPFACDPEALLPLLIGDLRHSGAAPAALADLESGEFLPGRGLLDMKGGLAAGMATLQRFLDDAGDPAIHGNLLFAAVPDEEVASNGMRSLARLLPDLCAAHSLDLHLAINLDSEVDHTDGSQGRAVFLGSVGKMLPLVTFLGRPAHAGAPFDGVNAALLLAEFVRLVESNPLAGDGTASGPAPPVVLYARETRDVYDVTMPASAWCAVNVLTHRQSAAEVLSRFRTLAAEALRSAFEILQARAGDRDLAARPPAVYTIEELRALCKEAPPPRESTGQVEACAAWTLDLAARARIEGPAAIVGFAPPFYPRADWTRPDLLAPIESARLSMGPGRIALRPYFPGISDMSFLSPVADGSAGVVDANCPAAIPSQAGTPACPAVNIGPWGRDYHQKTERLHGRYCFEELPELLWRVVRNTLAAVVSASSHTRQS